MQYMKLGNAVRRSASAGRYFFYNFISKYGQFYGRIIKAV